MSDRMERDLALGLDDPYDELAVESLKLMREEEDMWFEAAGTVVPVETTDGREVDGDETEVDGAGDGEDDDVCAEDSRPLSLVIFLRTNACARADLRHQKAPTDGIERAVPPSRTEPRHLLPTTRIVNAHCRRRTVEQQRADGEGTAVPTTTGTRTTRTTGTAVAVATARGPCCRREQ